MSAIETIAAAREQGGLVGIPHPVRPVPRVAPARCGDGAAWCRPWTGSRRTTRALSGTATRRRPSSRASMACPGSPSRTRTRSWRSASPTSRSTAIRRRAAGLLAALPSAEIVPGRASYFVRLWTPVAKGVNRLRGNGRIAAASRTVQASRTCRSRRQGTARRERPARRAGPSSDGRRDGRSGRVRCDGGHPSTRRADPAPRPRFARRGARDTNRPRSRRSRSGAGCASRGRSCRSSSRWASSRFFLYLNRERLSAVPELILQANPALVLLAFIVFYLGFPLRGYRWERLLRETGFVIGLRNSIEILYLSWFVNCVVPAKLGDVYRAYLLKMNSPASLSRTFGTVFIERILDIFAIAILGLAAGFWSFRTGMPPAIRLVFIVGIVVVVVAAVGLFTMRNFGRRILDPAAAAAAHPRAVRALRGGRLRRGRAPPPADPGVPDRADLADRGPAPLHRRPGPRLPGRRARAVGRDLRGAHRLAADGHPAQPGRARLRPGRRHRRADGGLRRPACPRRPRSPSSTG